MIIVTKCEYHSLHTNVSNCTHPIYGYPRAPTYRYVERLRLTSEGRKTYYTESGPIVLFTTREPKSPTYGADQAGRSLLIEDLRSPPIRLPSLETCRAVSPLCVHTIRLIKMNLCLLQPTGSARVALTSTSKVVCEHVSGGYSFCP